MYPGVTAPTSDPSGVQKHRVAGPVGQRSTVTGDTQGVSRFDGDGVRTGVLEAADEGAGWPVPQVQVVVRACHRDEVWLGRAERARHGGLGVLP